MKYIAYMPTGEIYECDDFRTIFENTRFRVRDDARAAIICRQSDKKVIAYMLDAFGLYKVFHPIEIHPSILTFIKAQFVMEYNEWMLKEAGLE